MMQFELKLNMLPQARIDVLITMQLKLSPQPAEQQPLAYPPDVQRLAELSFISPYKNKPPLDGIVSLTSEVRNDQHNRINVIHTL